MIAKPTKKYTLILDGKLVSETFSRKERAIVAGEASGTNYEILSPSGKVVHGSPAEESPGKIDLSEKYQNYEGNYSIEMVPFAQKIVEAMGCVQFREEKLGGLSRRVYFSGSADQVKAASEKLVLLEDEVMEALHIWQKKNIESRRGKTDQARYVEHREFIRKMGESNARKIKRDKK